MSLIRLSFSNFKRDLREYGALVIALAFSVFVYYNFQSVIYSDSMDVLMTMNKEYIDLVVQTASVVFGVFLFFFIWYSSNVFLRQRKRETGIYIFMGLDNRKIAKMYVLEAMDTGLFALGLGTFLGVLFCKLFQMLLFWLSDIAVDVRFSFSFQAWWRTLLLFGVFYGLVVLKGYVSIVRSSVLALLSGEKQEELRVRNRYVQAVQIVIGFAVLGSGYFCALKTGDISSLGYGLAAVILVIVGIYLSFGGAIPALLRGLTRRKEFLYKKQRSLWVNNLAFRVRQNCRTYAMVTVLMISAVTVLAISIAMKQRYDRMVHFRQTYSYQVVSTGKELDGEEIGKNIGKTSELLYENQIACLCLNPGEGKKDASWETRNADCLVSYSDIRQAAEAAGLPFAYPKLQEKEVILLHQVYLMSLVRSAVGDQILVNGEEYMITAEDSTAYLGDLQSQLDICIVSDETFARLEPFGIKMYLYNYKIGEESQDEATMRYLSTLTERADGQYTVGVNRANMESSDIAWIRIFYSLCLFLFATLILASGSIIFIKLGNDAYADAWRYRMLMKLGTEERILKKSIRNEIRFTYYCPFAFMVVTSWFAVRALGNVMKENLLRVNVYSAVSVLVLFTVIYLISEKIFIKKVLE